MEYSKIIKSANILFNSRRNLKKIKGLPRDCTPKNFNEAYLIQDQLSNKYLSKNPKNKIIGKKIGCTNEDAKKQLNITESFFGNLFSKDISKSNCTIKSKHFFSPYIEPEFSFVMNNELSISNAPYKNEDVYKFISCVLPSIELVDSRYKDWTSIGVYNLVADNAVHAHWVYGNSYNNFEVFNLNNHKVTLYINDNEIVKGNSSKVLGNPINSLTWLINNLAKQGKTLKKNSYVSTGTCTQAIAISKGDRIRADFGKLGIVNFSYQ